MNANYHLHNAIIVGINNEELIIDRQYILDHYRVNNMITKQQPEDAAIFIELLSNIYADNKNLILFNSHYENEKEDKFIQGYLNLNSEFLKNTKLIIIGKNQASTHPNIFYIEHPLERDILDKIILV